MIYNKNKSVGWLIFTLITMSFLVFITIKFIEPSKKAFKTFSECEPKVKVWSDDCYKTCKPESDKWARCKDGECKSQASLLLNYCSESCRAFTEAEINKCSIELEDNSPIRKTFKQIGL